MTIAEAMIWIVAIGLASARLSVLLVDDVILEPLRRRLFLRFPPKDNPAWGFEYQRMDRKGQYLPVTEHRDWSWFGELLTCNRCTSVWATGAVFMAAWSAGIVDGGQIELTIQMVAAMWVASWGAGRIA